MSSKVKTINPCPVCNHQPKFEVNKRCWITWTIKCVNPDCPSEVFAVSNRKVEAVKDWNNGNVYRYPKAAKNPDPGWAVSL